MAKVKHNPDAKQLIDEGISQAEPFAQIICKKLRSIIIKAEPHIIEDWKWGPNYYKDGMVCGFWHFKKHVSFVFFQGALLKDKKKVLQQNPGNLHNRHIKFSDIKEVDEKLLIEYITEAVINNEKGLKLTEAKDKTVVIPEDFKKLLTKNKVLKIFEAMSYSKRKDYVLWIEGAKQAVTRSKRIETALEKIAENQGLNDKYMKYL
ncbi:MAG: YdeI/OmpD-associated family protein [Bacteroidota bacterium]